jgi:hypothetical protein
MQQKILIQKFLETFHKTFDILLFQLIIYYRDLFMIIATYDFVAI